MIVGPPWLVKAIFEEWEKEGKFEDKTMTLKDGIKKILKENACDMCCSDSCCTSDYVRVNAKIDEVAKLIMKVINDNTLMEPLK